MIRKIDILYPQPYALHQPHPRSVQQRPHERLRALKTIQQSRNLATLQYDRKPARPLRPHEIVQFPEFKAEHLLIEEDQRVERLILSARGDLAADGQILEKGNDPIRTELRRVVIAAKQDETADP